MDLNVQVSVRKQHTLTPAAQAETVSSASQTAHQQSQ